VALVHLSNIPQRKNGYNKKNQVFLVIIKKPGFFVFFEEKNLVFFQP